MTSVERCVKLRSSWFQKSGFKVTRTLTLSWSQVAHVGNQGGRITVNTTTTPNERSCDDGWACPDIRGRLVGAFCVIRAEGSKFKFGLL